MEEVRNRNISTLMTIHDLSLAARYCDKFAMLSNGELYAAGGPEIINQHNIQTVYGVKVSVMNHRGRKLIIPEEPLNYF